ncbi:uncharacterized protein LOC144162578 isoform X2 [Haemaphysalis longicornis]
MDDQPDNGSRCGETGNVDTQGVLDIQRKPPSRPRDRCRRRTGNTTVHRGCSSSRRNSPSRSPSESRTRTRSSMGGSTNKQAHQTMDVVDGARGGSASGAPLHTELTSDDYFELVVQEAERVGAAAGGSPTKTFKDAMRFHRELQEGELSWQKQCKDKELEKEGFACLRTIVPGLNKRSSYVAVVQETGNYIKQLHEEILARFGKAWTSEAAPCAALQARTARRPSRCPMSWVCPSSGPPDLAPLRGPFV